MIGFNCLNCGREHRDRCPVTGLDAQGYTEQQAIEQSHRSQPRRCTTVMIPEYMNIGEEVTIFSYGHDQITLKRVK